MRVQHNIASMNSYRNYNNNTKSINKNLEKLSSGYRINRAGDDAAGLAISEKMRAQITGLDGAQKNAKDGISLVQTAEGALTEVHSMLNRMYSLAEQSANGTYDSTTDRFQLQKEVESLRSEINRIADSSNFNGIKLLDGSASGLEASTAWTAVGFGIQNVTAQGGALNSSLNTKTLTDAISVSMTTAGDITLAWKDSTNMDGVKWAVANGPDVGDPGNSVSGTWEGSDIGSAGSVTFKAVVDYENNKLTSENARIYDGMTVTVRVAGWNTSTEQYVAQTATDVTFDPGEGLTLQIGDTADTFNQLKVDIGSVKSEELNIDDVDISTVDGAQTAMGLLKDAINKVSDIRGGLGATQNRLEHTINNLSVMQENIQDAESTIRDTDVADEMMKYTKNSILVQSAQAMLAQANQQPQGVLQLLQ